MAVRDSLGPVMAAFIGIDGFVVLARLAVRTKLTTLGYDDYVIAVAMVAFTLMCAFTFVSLNFGFGITDPEVIAGMANYNLMESQRYFTVAQITYVAGFPIVRISVALVLYRLVQGWPRTQKLLLGTMVFIFIYALGCLLVDVFQCIPLKAVWGDGTGKCLTSKQLAGLGFAVASLDIASALFYAVLPVFLLKGLQMGRRTKVAIIILLGLGASTVIISIIRMKSLVQIVNAKSIPEALDYQLESFIYSVLEFGLSILTASLVAFRPLIKFLPFGSFGRSSGPKAHSGGDSSGPGISGRNDFEMGRRKYVNMPDPARIDSDDGDSQREILHDTDHPSDWKHSGAVTSTTTLE
ncbi:hypothetical protein NW752_011127 [Fusarium irregulare]|uniref:Rhodopsin domain-containing protein n=1 Tax=Fusarium irregulare TaxID=2494466 RepID=A0A9W8PE30_9HYPO|nr:hypothetical protein NW766_012156 [Fusarium irregulare]KAJ4005798.1 hypothetical protein NW752_011127 [Fusarium irregulare]